MKAFSLKTLLVLVLVLLISGCGTRTVTIVEFVGTFPDDALLLDCPVEPPPARSKYLTTDDKGREALSTQAYNRQTANVTVCNEQKAGLRKWKSEQNTLLNQAQQEK
jgi:hypothetical protein